MYFRKNTAENLTFNVELVNGDLDVVVDKLDEVQKNVRDVLVVIVVVHSRERSGRTVLLASSPARTRPATPPCASTRPARGMSAFWNRQVILGLRGSQLRNAMR